jgi:hypothetical protein
MTSRVKVHMTVCDKTHLISVSAAEDGTFRIEAETECDHVKEFVEMVNPLSMTDLSDKANSKIFESMKRCAMSPTCITPVAIMNAAWIEAGMLSKNLALRSGSISVEYLKD